MGYDIGWKIDKRVILCKIVGNITAKEIMHANEQLRQRIDEGENPVHAILHLSDLKNFPLDIRLFKSDYPFHETDGWILLVGANAIMNYSATVVAKFIGSNIEHLDTLEEAYQFLAEKDLTLQFDD